ncbi:hypothetical protein [Sulfobacillus harzensis]|uniref:Uncharacterized protein n=1 Tax=Sulfobacillus harzensis TaxID=2729629 RepID=A0A7Y0Q335_9FIRM|nr:hypothetical protein [Sulfobacillus harzensis]
MAINVEPSSADAEWVTIEVNRDDCQHAVVAINREALKSIINTDPRPPEIILDLLCERAVKRMPVPNSADGVRLITPYNLGLVWPK